MGIVLCFSVDDNFDQYDAGLVTFIKAGPGEEWRLVQVEDEEMDTWTPESGWQVMLYNMQKFNVKTESKGRPGRQCSDCWCRQSRHLSRT